jgi:hypothetical protein
MKTLKLLLISFSMFNSFFINAQSDRELFASANPAAATAVDAPRNVVASDGLYDRYVLVHWEPSAAGTRYKVLRTDREKGGTLQEVSQNWQQGTWLCYSVVANNGRDNSKVSVADKGFVKRKDGIVDDMRSLSSVEKFATEKQVALMINGATTNKNTHGSGEALSVSVQMANIFDEATRRTEVRFFFSKDAVLDWDDKILALKTLASVPAGATLTVNENMTLPMGLMKGEYFLLVVSSTEGGILNSRMHPIKIQVMR